MAGEPCLRELDMVLTGTLAESSLLTAVLLLGGADIFVPTPPHTHTLTVIDFIVVYQHHYYNVYRHIMHVKGSVLKQVCPQPNPQFSVFPPLICTPLQFLRAPTWEGGCIPQFECRWSSLGALSVSCILKNVPGLVV